jgi:hypothetical protein
VSETLPRVSEKNFQQQVLQLARLSGWMVYHTFDSRRSTAGFPDLCLVRVPRVIFAELKSAAGKIRPEQKAWLGALKSCPGVEVFVWRPGDWPEIEKTLYERSRRKEA